MSGLLLKNVNKIYPGGQQAIRDFNLEIKKREFLILAGPDGCGKSTLLRMIAGLEEITSGSLYIDGENMTDAEPRERNIAMIFKNSVLYPEMTVYENMAFALRMAKMAPAEIEERIKETAEVMNLTGLLEKDSAELAPEETYRALVGRALMRRPRILLLDSTLADMDEDLQAVARQELLNLHRKMDMTVIYVTDNQKTAMTLGSRMLVMEDGVICQDDTPEMLAKQPVSSFVAGVAGYPQMNFFSAVVYEENGRAGLNFKNGKVLLLAEKGGDLLKNGYVKKEVIVGVRADAVTLTENKKADGVVAAKVLGMEKKGSQTMLRFVLGETEGVCLVENTASFEEGGRVSLIMDAEKIQIFDRDTEKTIVY